MTLQDEVKALNATATEEAFIPDKNRGKWANKIEFILSCLGYAIGIGNIWRFPYLCYRNGGGAFLIPFLIMLVLCGIPLFYLEILIGQFTSTGCISIFRMCPLLKGTGYAIVVVNIICTTYYAVIVCYPLNFIVRSIATKLPWEDCENPWNTVHCVPIKQAKYFLNTTGSGTSGSATSLFRTPADEFFHLEILKLSSGINELGGMVWPLLGCLIVAWVIVFLCIIKGVKTVGKVVYVTATFPFIILAILLIRGITLPGALNGIKYYITPEWERLTDLKVWADAAIQIFFSLGPGWGGIVNMASYNNFRNKAKWDAIFIPIVNIGTSIFGGFVVFSVLGYLSEETGIPVSQVATSGPGLAFVTYPEAIALLPFPQFWAVLFFLMLFLLGLDSVFVQIEAIISSVVDEYRVLQKKKLLVTVISCFTMFLISTIMVTQGGIFILQLLDWYSASIAVILICFIEVVMVAYSYGLENFAEDIFFMVHEKLGCWSFIWKYLTPLPLLLFFITTIAFNRRVTFNEIEYPDWAIAIGWCSCFISILCIPGYAIYKISKLNGSFRDRLKTLTKPVDWYPANAQIREEYLKDRGRLSM